MREKFSAKKFQMRHLQECFASIKVEIWLEVGRGDCSLLLVAGADVPEKLDCNGVWGASENYLNGS